MFRTPVHLGLDAGGAQLLLQVAAQSFDVAFAIRALLVQRGGEASILFRLEVSERQILELPFELPDTQTIGQGREHGSGLDGEPVTLLGRQVACVPQLHQLLGEPREHQSRIADDGQQHLAKHLGLSGIQTLRGGPAAR